MPNIRFYFDEHIPKSIATQLIKAGIDVEKTSDQHRQGANDTNQLLYAIQSGRVIFTMDTDFFILISTIYPHNGIVYAQQQTLSIGDIVKGLKMIHNTVTAQEMTNNIIYLTRHFLNS